MLKRVAIVRGGAGGIGLAASRELAEEGFCLAIMGPSSEEKVKERLDQLPADKGDIIYIQGSLGDRQVRNRRMKTVLERFGRVDVLVNNAGVGPKQRLDMLETSEESYDYVMHINLKGTFFLTQAVAKQMIKQKNQMEGQRYNQPMTIIIISSISEYTSSINRGEYCISKAGLGMVTKLFADRLANEGIQVFGIRPGIIRTDMTKTVAEKYDKLIAEGILPMKRWGEPEDIAKAVSVLCSGKMEYCVGQTIDVDGGFHIRRL